MSNQATMAETDRDSADTMSAWGEGVTWKAKITYSVPTARTARRKPAKKASGTKKESLRDLNKFITDNYDAAVKMSEENTKRLSGGSSRI